MNRGIIIIPIIIVIAVLAGGGGGYWYEFKYRPVQYEKELLEVLRTNVGKYPIAYGISHPSGVFVTPGALAEVELREQEIAVTELKTQVVKISPPYFGSQRRLHSNFIQSLDNYLVSAIPETKKIAQSSSSGGFSVPYPSSVLFLVFGENSSVFRGYQKTHDELRGLGRASKIEQPALPAEGQLVPREEMQPVAPIIQQSAPAPVVEPKAPESFESPITPSTVTIPAPVALPEVIEPVQKISGPFIGLWKAEKLYGFNPNTQQWEEGKLLTDMFFEFKTDGTACAGGWTITVDGYHCGIYSPYTVSGDTVIVERFGAVYKWKLVYGKLEMITMISGTPFLRYIAPLTTYAATKPAPKTDFNKPVVQLFEITVAVNSQTGKKEATLKCRATDDTAVKYIWMNLVYAGENISWTRSPQVDDANIKDQTWTAPGFDAEKSGTHKATCSADDAAGNASVSVEKTFTVSLTNY